MLLWSKNTGPNTEKSGGTGVTIETTVMNWNETSKWRIIQKFTKFACLSNDKSTQSSFVNPFDFQQKTLVFGMGNKTKRW